MQIFMMFKDIMRNLVKGPVTRNYPKVKRPPFSGERGKLIMAEESLCIYCGICSKKCPSNAITVSRKPNQEWRFEQYRCILCGSCVDACPKKCLKLVPRLEEN